MAYTITSKDLNDRLTATYCCFANKTLIFTNKAEGGNWCSEDYEELVKILMLIQVVETYLEQSQSIVLEDEDGNDIDIDYCLTEDELIDVFKSLEKLFKSNYKPIGQV